MAFFSNALGFPNLTTKATPTTSDILLIADSAASNAIKQCTIGTLPGGASSTNIGKVYPITIGAFSN